MEPRDDDDWAGLDWAGLGWVCGVFVRVGVPYAHVRGVCMGCTLACNLAMYVGYGMWKRM